MGSRYTSVVSDDHANPRAIRAVVSGAVQGVGFREVVRRRADVLGLMGWVRNAEDGSVVVHAEGSSEEIDKFLGFLREGPRGAVSDMTVDGKEVEPALLFKWTLKRAEAK